MKPPDALTGYRAYSMPRCRVLEVDYFARPDRGSDWTRRTRRKLGPVAFNREYGRSFDTPAGNPYYPEFADDPQKFLRTTTKLISGPVIRGWDLGGNHPAMVAGQWSPVQGLLWIYREVEARKLVIHDFRDLGRYLCGEIPYDQLEREQRIGALRWLEREDRQARYGVPIPWFPPGTTFADWAGKEMNRTQSISGKTEADIFAEVGIFLQTPDEYMLEDHERVMRFLMSKHPQHGCPRLLIDPACQELVLALSGGLSYPKKGGDKPHKDGRADDIHDAAKYLASGVAPIKTVAAMELLKTSDPTKDEAVLAKEVYAEEQEDLPTMPWGQTMQGLRWDR